MAYVFSDNPFFQASRSSWTLDNGTQIIDVSYNQYCNTPIRMITLITFVLKSTIRFKECIIYVYIPVLFECFSGEHSIRET